MLKPLSCCLLSHYSIACYFLKQEKAIYPQRSVERFATRTSLGIWEVTLKFEECGEGLKSKQQQKTFFWNGEASFSESRCGGSQRCSRCPQGGNIIDSTDDSAETFQSTNGMWRNWHSLRALTYSRWISDIWFPFPSSPKTVNAGSGAFQWNRLFDFLCYQFSISVCHRKQLSTHRESLKGAALLLSGVFVFL